MRGQRCGLFMQNGQNLLPLASQHHFGASPNKRYAYKALDVSAKYSTNSRLPSTPIKNDKLPQNRAG
ncbi:MAG: hypothetical protein EAY75_13060 [Bacteroidetes bacterium]|nr:MAG: hypothetical protein EAY75_13060 [Bacteroidota bacterium]